MKNVPVTAFRVLFAALLLIVTWLTITPNPDDAGQGFAFAQWLAAIFLGNGALGDKVAHFLAYGALGFSAFWARLPIAARSFTVPIGLMVYGVLLEGVQGLGAVRTPELADALANGAGAISGFGGGVVLMALLRMVRS